MIYRESPFEYTIRRGRYGEWLLEDHEANVPLIHHTVDAVLMAVAQALAAKVLVPVPAVPSPLLRVSEVIAIERTPEPTLINEIIEPTGIAIVPLAGIV